MAELLSMDGLEFLLRMTFQMPFLDAKDLLTLPIAGFVIIEDIAKNFKARGREMDR